MGHITYPDGVAIFQVVYYVPALFGSIIVAARHGAMKSSGWVFLCIFCVIRIVGASGRIATIQDPNSSTAFTVALSCSVLGLSPLLMASLGLLARAFYSMLAQPWNMIFSLFIVKIVHIPAVIALILCIVGATSASSPEQVESESTVHIGVALYTAVFVMITILTLVACVLKQKKEKGEGLLVLAVLAALPLIGLRLLYALLSAFSHSSTFGLANGSETAVLFMSVLPEMVVALIYIATGLKLSSVPDDVPDTPDDRLAYRMGRGDFGTGKLGLLSLGLATFQAFKKSNKENTKEEERAGGKTKQREYSV